MNPRPAAAFHAAPLILFLLLAGIFSGSASRVVLEPRLPPACPRDDVSRAPALRSRVFRRQELPGPGNPHHPAPGLRNGFHRSWQLVRILGAFRLRGQLRRDGPQPGQLPGGILPSRGRCADLPCAADRPHARGGAGAALTVFASYGGVAVLLVLLSYLAATGSLPPFFPRTGPIAAAAGRAGIGSNHLCARRPSFSFRCTPARA